MLKSKKEENKFIDYKGKRYLGNSDSNKLKKNNLCKSGVGVKYAQMFTFTQRHFCIC